MTDNLNSYPGTYRQHKVEPFLSDANFRLCYVRGECAYFTTQPLADQWGDDWNDAPYEHNACSPYSYSEHDAKSGKTPWEIRKVYFDGNFEAPCEWYTNSPFSVEDINAGNVPWLSPSKYGQDHGVKIMAGTTLPEFRRMIESVGGDVYEAELTRLRGLLDEARVVLEEINEEPMAKMPQELWKQLRSVLSNLKK